jgi:hypothetical protein
VGLVVIAAIILIVAAFFVAALVLMIQDAQRRGVLQTGRASQGPPPLPDARPLAPTLVRVYRGKQQQDAVRRFEMDAARLSDLGYDPVGQSWASGQWGAGAFLLAVVLFFLLIGILIFLYLLIVKPEGTLTVTYRLRDTTPAFGPAPAPISMPGTVSPPLAVRLGQLDEAYRQGLITEQEYLAKRQGLLSNL